MPAIAAIAGARLTTRTSTLATSTDWRGGLPLLVGAVVRLRELRHGDAASLLTSLGSPEVTRLISPPPPTLAGFEKFIAWTIRQREEGKSIAYGITLKGSDTVIGLFQVRATTPRFDVAEWGFAVGSAFWGTGIFMDAARLVLDFSFGQLGVHRMEAKAAVKNGRGNGALQKLGMVQEAVLRGSFLRHGVYLDQSCWALMSDTWRELSGARAVHLLH